MMKGRSSNQINHMEDPDDNRDSEMYKYKEQRTQSRVSTVSVTRMKKLCVSSKQRPKQFRKNTRSMK